MGEALLAVGSAVNTTGMKGIGAEEDRRRAAMVTRVDFVDARRGELRLGLRVLLASCSRSRSASSRRQA
jgi:hypothetical protein